MKRYGMKRWLMGFALVAFLFPQMTFGGSGGNEKQQTVNIVEHQKITQDFNNIVINTADQFRASTTIYGGSSQKYWNNLDQNIFLSNLQTAIQSLYTSTGNIPQAVEIQNALQGMSEQYLGGLPLFETYTATTYNYMTPKGSVTENGYLGGMLDWAWNTGHGSHWDMTLQSVSAGISSYVTNVSGAFSATYTFAPVSNTNRVSLISGGIVISNTVNVSKDQTLSGKASADAQGTLYSLNTIFEYTPLVLDLSGKGKIEASEGNWLPHQKHFYTNNLALFDLLGDGFPVVMEWVGPGDGLLVAPKTGNCSMTHIDGTCLFGALGGFVNGFEKLAAFDKDQDGKLTGNELNGLYVWQDKNGNAKLDPGELQSVQALGITEINVAHNPDMTGAFVRNGKKYLMWDWYPNAIEVNKQKE